MAWLTHSIPVGDFSALASGGGGAVVARALGDVQYSRNTLLVTAVAGRDSRRDLRRDLRRLLELAERGPDARRVLTHPSVGVQALRALRSGRPRPEELLAVLTAAAAVRARAPGTYRVPVSDGTLTLPSLGRALAPEGVSHAEVHVPARAAPGTAAHIHIAGHRIRVPSPTGLTTEGWQGLRPLSPTVVVDDIDPHRFPRGLMLAPRLDEDALARLRESFGGAMRLLARHHPSVAEEVDTIVSTVTPLATDPAGHSSATAREAFGCVAFSVPVDARQLAVTFAHEIQHAKLSALMDAFSLLPQNTRPGRFYAPWRPDPRPLPGLLHGTYAFLGVTGFWRRQRHHDHGDEAFEAHVEFARWREAVRIGLDQLLAEPGLPPLGVRFVRGMHDTLTAWARDPVPDAARRKAARLLDEHRTAWTAAHGPPAIRAPGSRFGSRA